MQRFGKKLFVLLLVAFLASFAAGCGQDTTAVEDSKKPVYKVATEAVFAPFEFRDSKTGDYVGFDVDLLNALAEAGGFEVELKDMGFDGIISSVQTGNVDFAVSGISITEKREKEVNFAYPYYESGLAIAVRSDNDEIKSFDDLEGKKLAVQIATTGAAFADSIPGATVTKFDHIPEALLELKNGGVDAIVNDLPVSAYYIKQSGGKDYKIVGDVYESEFYGIAVAKDNPEMLQTINDALTTIKENGEYAKIYKEWFEQDPPDFLPGEPNE